VCADRTTDDGRTTMGFYGNAVIEYRPSPTACEVHGRAVVLAEGSTGADALAAGWWTSYWQVPVLLVDGHGQLPPATERALSTLDIDTIVVLGGMGRIPESTVARAKALAGAAVGRFGGRDRYETSVLLAEVFGGWWPTGDAADSEADRVCVAASGGVRPSAGWPDALAAGPWCARLAASRRPAPARFLDPVESATAAVAEKPSAHDAVPVVLVPAGSDELPRSVAELLQGAFPEGVGWCRGGTIIPCSTPGFAVAIGGTASISDAQLAAVSTLVGGGAPRSSPVAAHDPFRTRLDLSPVYRHLGATDGGDAACTERAAITGARWLAVYTDLTLDQMSRAVDVAGSKVYDGGRSIPACVDLPGDEAGSVVVVGVSARGDAGLLHQIKRDADRTLAMSAPMTHRRAEAAYASDDPGAAAQTSGWSFRDAPRGSLEVTDRGVAAKIEEAAVDLTLVRRAGGGPVTFAATVQIRTRDGSWSGDVTGEAVLDGSRWQLAGRFRLAGASGGFRATLDTRDTPSPGDDGLSWQVDATYL
jgi:hypothetical protein